MARENKYTFRKTSKKDPKKSEVVVLTESELSDEQLNYMFQDFLRNWHNLPVKLRDKFKKIIIRDHKEKSK